MYEQDDVRSGDISVTCPVTSRKPLSVQEKFRAASVTTDALAQLVASGGDVDIEEIQLGIHHTGDPGTADVV